MEMHRNPLFWSISLGTWFGVRMRVSIFFPLMQAWLWFHWGLNLGTAVGALLFVSVVLHEFGHILASNATGGTGDEIVIWPLGGLALVDSRGSTRSMILTALAGPGVNLALCLLTLPAVYFARLLPGALNPFVSPMSREAFWANPIQDLQVILFFLNWMMLLINLTPAYPLDGGQVVRGWLTGRYGSSMAGEISIKIAYGAAFVLGIIGIFSEITMLLGLCLMIFILALLESQQAQGADGGDDSFLGYDFSQGYTSLEKSQPKAEQKPKKLSFWQRWQERRKQEKQKRTAMAQERAEQQLDELLAKVHERGIGALTEAEKRVLKQASERFRSKDGGG